LWESEDSLPIRREDFEKGRIVSDTEKAILQFLNQNKDQAFTMEEILAGLGYLTGQNFWQDMSLLFTLNTMLETLVLEDKVTVRQVSDGIKTQNYYAAR